MKSFGAKVKEQRGNLGLSQKQLAEKAGMGIRTITSYELGERKPYQAQLYKLAKNEQAAGFRYLHLGRAGIMPCPADFV